MYKKYKIIKRNNFFRLNCGICSFVFVKKFRYKETNLSSLFKFAKSTISSRFRLDSSLKNYIFDEECFFNKFQIYKFLKKVKILRSEFVFLRIFFNKYYRKNLLVVINLLNRLIVNERLLLNEYLTKTLSNKSFIITSKIELLEDISWCFSKELARNFFLVDGLLFFPKKIYSKNSIFIFKQINFTLNSIDKLEVRGRDSAGISILFVLSLRNFRNFKRKINEEKLTYMFVCRQKENLSKNRNIHCIFSSIEKNPEVTIIFTYKIASEIGSLGDNTDFLRQEIKKDKVFHYLILVQLKYYLISSHTRWASIGSISEENCHPLDNITKKFNFLHKNVIQVCLNGEIDNYLELKTEHISSSSNLQKEITTDTKIIPVIMEEYINNGFDVISAFRLTVNEFYGSHSIIMNTNLSPGTLFIAQKGSGQSMYVGLSKNSYIPTSEVYGFVEKTNKFIKMDGDKIVKNLKGEISGQIFIINQNSNGGVNNISAMHYDGTPICINNLNVKLTKITSKDIDRKKFKHYFLKEIYESPLSVTKTLNRRWSLEFENGEKKYRIRLSKKNLPKKIQIAFTNNLIKNVFFIGQGTAGVAADACSNILNYFLLESHIKVYSLRSSEFCIFQLNRVDLCNNLKNTLVIAITQSGSTTDTNQTIDLVKNKGAYTLAIVNRRDSDITFSVDGIIYTSTGRDIEMSVASTKAFYSQIVAGAILGLQILFLTKKNSADFISSEINSLLKIPQKMKKILEIENIIKDNAQKFAGKRCYWATVGSSLNKVSADEIRIKLSELCYKAISSDFIEDKKHIDLSSEPLILVFTAGSNEKIMNNIVKNIAIFKAHKAIPIVIANKGENRFNLYANYVFYVPKISEHYSPVLNTLVGHIWGYYAALSINDVSKMLSDFRDKLQWAINKYIKDGFDIFEIIRKKNFISGIDEFYELLRKKMIKDSFPLSNYNFLDMILLLKYLSGRLPFSDFEFDFGKKGTASNIVLFFFEKINELINDMSRPIDAIRHQAKTVTVGSSIINSKLNGVLFEMAEKYNFNISQIENKNIIVIKNLQKVIHVIQGTIFYTITKLNSMGKPSSITEIKIQGKSGISKSIPSRVENDKVLKGTKMLVVAKGNIYVGKGRKDGQNIIVIPICSNTFKKTNKIRHLLLLNVVFRKKIALKIKIKALGEKYNNIKNIVQESNIQWNDFYVDEIKTGDLFGFSAEKIGEYIVSKKVVPSLISY